MDPRNTKPAFGFFTLLSLLTFSGKCHSPVISCRAVGRETRDHTSFVLKETYSRCIAAFQLRSARASAADSGTVDATNASLCSGRFSSSSPITKSSSRQGCLTFLRCCPCSFLCGCVVLTMQMSKVWNCFVG